VQIKNKNLIDLNIEAFKAFDSGDFGLSAELFKQSLSIEKTQPEILYSLAFVLSQLNLKTEAIDLYQKAINLKDDYVDAIYNLAILFYDLKKFDESLEMFNQALAIDPSAEVYNNKALVLKDLNKFDEALETFNQAIAINPSAEVYNNKALVLKDLNKFDEALETFNQALAINPSAEVYNNMGLVLKELKRFDDALEAFDESLNLDSGITSAYVEKAGIYFRRGNDDLSVRYYKEALKINPESVEAHIGLGLIYLANKNFKDGWDFYGYRIIMPDVFVMMPKLTKPLFKKQNYKRMLILAEQGIGDHILYMSLIKDFYLSNNSIDIAINPKLIPLLNRSFKGINFLSSKSVIDVSIYDCQLPMASVCSFVRPSLESFKNQTSKFLYAESLFVKELKSQLKKDLKFVCGISWKSAGEIFGQDKSISLESLLPILKLPNITFVSLQYGDTREEIEVLNKTYGIQIKTIDEIDNFNDIDGLASLIDACDFVVTTSNVTVHLAGGLGKESHLLVPFSHGKIWYWHEGDTRSIWYPSVNIYRQSNLDNWCKPINDIAHILENKKN